MSEAGYYVPPGLLCGSTTAEVLLGMLLLHQAHGADRTDAIADARIAIAKQHYVRGERSIAEFEDEVAAILCPRPGYIALTAGLGTPNDMRRTTATDASQQAARH